jgi:hypothetical protein
MECTEKPVFTSLLLLLLLLLLLHQWWNSKAN